MNGKLGTLMLAFALLFAACQKPAGSVRIDFSAVVDGEVLQQDTCRYVNAAGNRYGVTEVQYFISDVALVRADGTSVSLQNGGAHYVDADIAGTLSWQPGDEIPEGTYTTLSFHFGLTPAMNQNFQFPNPPENAMSWPTHLGGGYHYMKINGWWIDPDGTRTPFNLHSGIGQQRDTEGNITGFIDNSFHVDVPLNNFVVHKNEEIVLTLQMDINRWFDTPNLFDFNVIGGSIMQNQEAQELLKANGWNVFEGK